MELLMKNKQQNSRSTQNERVQTKFLSSSILCLLAGTALLLGWAIYQYAQNPNWLQTQYDSIPIDNSSPSEAVKQEQLSSEELSLGADLENLDVLLKEIEQNEAVISNLAINKQPSSKNKSTINRQARSLSSGLEKSTSKSNSNNNQNISRSSLNKTIEASAINQLIQPASLLLTQPNSTLSENNLGKNSSQTNQKVNPIGQLYLTNKNQQLERENTFGAEQLYNYNDRSNTSDNPTTVQTNVNPKAIATPNIWRSQPMPYFGQINQTNADNSSSSNLSPSSLSSYQIPLQNYNQLIPNNYQFQPPTLDRVSELNRHSSSTVDLPNNNLSNYQLPSSEIERVNSAPTPQLNSESFPGESLNNFDNSSLQPSGMLSTGILE